MAQFRVLVWTDPRLGGPHCYSVHRTRRAADRAARVAHRQYPTCGVSVVETQKR
jgi:hypothetical protein